MSRSARLLAMLLASVAVLAMLAGPASATVPAKKSPPACAGSTKSAAVKQIKAAYNTVLNGTTGLTLAQKTAGIQEFDDPAFQALFQMIAQQEMSMLATTSVQVNTVTCTGKTKANVKYTLVLSGKPTPNLGPPGNAVVYENMWRVSKGTICDLFSLLNPSIATSGPCTTP